MSGGNVKGINIEIGGDTKGLNKALSETKKETNGIQIELRQVERLLKLDPKNVDLLAQKEQLVGKQIDATKGKLQALRDAKDKADKQMADGTEVNEKQYRQLQREIAQAEQDLKKLDEQGEKTHKSVRDAAKGMGSSLATVGKGIAVGAAAGVAAVGAATVAIGVSIVKSYAEYEQLVGGVDTLFKESSSTVQEYAANAYKTAGLSANEYMETVTSFSASLIASLGGDTAKASQYADQAITDMADNANKMGTDMGSIQNAYQGFAKQNYTMLDNLKLGYGGTKEEMQRLLVDAEKLSGQKFDISSYADVTQAIHTIQESMGIAGTTALEAEHTISGSIGALQSAFSNMITGLGNSDADMEMLMQNLVDAFQNVVANITPIISNIVQALPSAVNAIIPAIGSLLPQLWTTVSDLFAQVLNMLLSLLPQLIPVAVDSVTVIVDALVDSLPLLAGVAIQLITTLITGIGSALPELIPAAVSAVTTIVQSLIDSLPMILDAGLDLILGLADGILAALPGLIDSLPAIINGIVTFFATGYPKLAEAGVKLLVSLVANLPSIIVAIVKAVPQIIAGIVSGFASGLVEMAKVGENLLKGLWNGISNTVAWLKSKVSGVVDKIKGWFTGKDGFDEHSPSKWAQTVGMFVSEGLAIGIRDGSQEVSDEFKHMMDDLNLQRDLGLADDRWYYLEMERLRDQYLEKGTSDWWKYTKEIINYEKTMTDNMKKDIVASYDEIAKTAADKMREVQDKTNKFAGNLKTDTLYNNQALFTLNGQEIKQDVLTDWDAENEKMKSYNDTLSTMGDRLKEAFGKDDSGYNAMMEMLRSDPYGEGGKVVGLLGKLSDAELQKYVSGYQEHVSLASQYAQSSYKSEADSIKTGFVDTLTDKLSSIPDEFKSTGQTAAEFFGDGFMENIATIMDTIKESMSIGLGNMSLGDFSGGLRSAAGGINNSKTNNIKISVTGGSDANENAWATRKAINSILLAGVM